MNRSGRADSLPLGPGRAVIHAAPSANERNSDWARLVPPWIISGVVHVVLLSLFLLLTLGTPAAAILTEETVIANPIDEDDPRDQHRFDEEEVGINPLQPAGFDVDPTDQTPVAGPVDASAVVGVPESPQTPQVTASPFGSGDGLMGSPLADRAGRGRMGEPGGTPFGLPGKITGFPGASGATRQRLLVAGGGNTRSEAAVASALRWLARHQNDNGSWGLHNFANANKCSCGNPARHPNDMAATALALLPFLGVGETHRSVGPANLYGKQVERGLKWIIDHQAADGQLGDGYSHALAAIVLCEAYGLTADEAIKPHAQSAINKIVDWQGPDGGFRYAPKQPGDLSVTGWHIQALTSAQLAGFGVPAATYRGVGQYLDRVANDDGSQFGYTDGKNINPRMSAVGLLSRQYMGTGPRHIGMVRGAEALKRQTPRPGLRDMYYYYYATQVLHNLGGESWDEWNVQMRDLLIETQDRGGDAEHRDQKGSWSPEGDPFQQQMGRLGMTALATLTLEVYYRRLPLFRRQAAAGKEAPVIQRRELGAQKDAAILGK